MPHSHFPLAFHNDGNVISDGGNRKMCGSIDNPVMVSTSTIERVRMSGWLRVDKALVQFQIAISKQSSREKSLRDEIRAGLREYSAALWGE